jgi:hypothetical protein
MHTVKIRLSREISRDIRAFGMADARHNPADVFGRKPALPVARSGCDETGA